MHEIPQSVSCFVCGAENPYGLNQRFLVEDGYVYTVFQAEPRHCGYPGVVHGGIVAALLDETLGWAASAVKRKYFMTADLCVRYRRPVPQGIEVRVVGRYLGDKLAFWLTEGEIIGPADQVYATATARYRAAPEEAGEVFLRQVQSRSSGGDPFGTPRQERP